MTLHTFARRRGLLAVAALALLFACAAAIGVVSRMSESRVLAAETTKLAITTVSVMHPTAEPARDEIVLPATVQAYVESPIYARTNGYLLRWHKDIGSRVRKGELLAEIDTPEVDQELRQARATRDQVQAQLQFTKISADRFQNLLKTNSVAQQDADQQTSGYQQAQANLAAAVANVNRLEELEGFKRVYAPFAGVITKRNVDVGSLINAGSNGTPPELFDLAQVDTLRVFVDVPQTYAPSIRVKLPASVQLTEYSGRTFRGTVARTADAINPATRTLRTEVDVTNTDGTLLPGAYATVHFVSTSPVSRLAVPVNTLLFRAEGPRAAVVDANGHVHLTAVTIGRDFGNTVEILDGLRATDQIILNPMDSLEDGAAVQIQAATGGAS
jgi:membrane fusion protein, multidrug efflux system